MPIRRKLAVIFVLSLGWIVAAVGLIRIRFFVDFWYGHFPDPSWVLWHTLSGVENNVAIIVACGPAIKGYIARFYPRLFGTSYASRPAGDVYYTNRNHELASRTQVRASAVKPVADRSMSLDARCGKGDSTEGVVQHSSRSGSSEFDFGFENDVSTRGRSAHAAPA